MPDIIHGFLPVFDEDCHVLILGSFPSVKSRKVEFYYGNKQNRFWPMLGRYFGEQIGEGALERRSFVLQHGIALWDIVVSCSIHGSADASIRNYVLADLNEILRVAPIQSILLNGTTAFRLFCEQYSGIAIPYLCLPSTSPANSHYNEQAWVTALDAVLNGKKKNEVKNGDEKI